MLSDDEAVRMHRQLADYHGRIAREVVLDILHEHHQQLAELLSLEAEHIPKRTEARARAAARQSETD